MRFILITVVVLFFSLTTSACMMMRNMNMGGGMHMKSMHNSNDTMDMGGAKMEIDNEELNSDSKSYIISKRYCTQCHEMKKKNLHNPKEWKPTLNRMLSYMKTQNKLKPDKYELVMIQHYYGIE